MQKDHFHIEKLQTFLLEAFFVMILHLHTMDFLFKASIMYVCREIDGKREIYVYLLMYIVPSLLTSLPIWMVFCT